MNSGLWRGSGVTKAHLQWFHAEHWTDTKDEDEREKEAITSHH